MTLPAGTVAGPVGQMEDGGWPLACRRLRDPKTPLLAGVLIAENRSALRVF